jgi:predicted 2-oxoglutarate/Fe(II)-dependent dioxygenase YbiX
VLFLSNESETPQAGAHCGGSLVFTDLSSGSKSRVVGEPGMLIAFRAETTHEITPVTHGERYSIVSWYR